MLAARQSHHLCHIPSSQQPPHCGALLLPVQQQPQQALLLQQPLPPLALQQHHRAATLVAAAQGSRSGSGSGSSKKSKRLSPVSQGLITVLKDELKVEKERYRTPSAVLDGPPGGYELQDKPNCTTLLLARSFGDEDVFVEVDVNEQDEGAGGDDEDDDAELDEEEEDALPPVVFSVSVTKGDAMMTFNCEADGSGIYIRHVSLADNMRGDDEGDEEEDEDEEDLPPYTGPVFDELDDTLQQAFADYLEERGITAEFGVYLMELVHDKLEVEYMNWLQRARDFFSSSS